ncbi:Stp1/IreP family PP2C-type Ser/Thr phosphatase [bacterium]|nr:Stp1/IreP family PP2C-type Ser/Thr phosphatase [bacterium]
MKIRDDITLGQHSHVGMVRTENQDFFGFWEPDDDREFDLKGRIVVVCDGMGGHAGGEIASRLAVQTVLSEYQKDDCANIQETLRKAIERANAAIYKEAQREAKLMGMGSTCTTLVHRRDMVYFGQVGDSRCYLIRNGKIKQMTKDHSLVQELVDQGLLDKSEMESHPDKNVILRSMGVKPTVEADVSYIPAAVGDIYLLCSDGLSGPVSEQEMLGIVQASDGDLRAASERLIELANRYGGFDNITVQLVKVNRTDTATTDKTDKATLTGSFDEKQVAESIAKARAAQAAAKKGEKPEKPEKPDKKRDSPPDAQAVANPAKGSPPPMPPTAAAVAIPRTEVAMPVPSGAEIAPPSGGGGWKLFLGLILGLVIGAGGMAGLVVTGTVPLPTTVGARGDTANLESSAAAALSQAKAEAERSQAERLAPAPWSSASKAEKEANSERNSVLRALAQHEAAASYRKAATEAREVRRSKEVEEARGAAEESQKGAAGRESSPAYKKAQEELSQAEQARGAKDLAKASAHYRVAQALFEVAGK